MSALRAAVACRRITSYIYSVLRIIPPCIAEFIGTAVLVLIGDGTVANVLLAWTQGRDAGLIVIVSGWAMAVFIAVFMTASSSGAHLNPVVTASLALAGQFAWSKVPDYAWPRSCPAARRATP
jgi:glycerol uptake facilitator-like aquaporin